MRKKFYILCLFAMMGAVTLVSRAGAPSGYYNSLNGLSGQALKDAVFNLISPHTVVSYNSLWSYFPQTDCHFEDPGKVWDMYSNNDYYFNGTKSVSGMNKEHSFPKSWWGGYTNYDAYTDLNHLYPSDGPANLKKSNWPLGEVSSASFDNGVTKVGTPVSGQGGGAGTVFEPDKQYKGDFARTYFYMATCYQKYTWVHTYMVTNSTWKTLNDWSIALLLKWSREDPISDKELARNEAVYKIQNNRNPFIDNPTLAEYIWGDKAGQVFNVEGGGSQGGDTTTTAPMLITPTQGTILDFGEVALGKSIDYKVFIKARNLTNDLNIQVYRLDYTMFSTNVTSVSRTVANSKEGYPLTITYTPTALGSHQAKLLISDGGLIGSIGVQLNAKCLPVPQLTAIVASQAQNVTDSSYVATWEAATDTIDNYLLNRIVYDANQNIVSNETFTVAPDVTTYPFTDFKPGQTHTYTVQSSRLGYTSVGSNVITVSHSGIGGIFTDKPLALITVEGGVIVKCSENLGTARIFNTSGQLVKVIPELKNDDLIELPGGVYFMTTSTSNKAVKLIIK